VCVCAGDVRSRAQVTADGLRKTKLPQILLNGSNVALLVPAGTGPE